MNKMESQDFQHIATTVRPKLMNLCQRFFDRQELAYDAEDAVQETLIRLWQMRVRIGDYQKPEALAMLIAKNVCIDILKLSKEQHETLDETANVITAAVPGLSPSRLYKNRRYRPLKQLIHHTLRCNSFLYRQRI